MCTHCGQLIKGIFKQGLQCQSCKITAHKKCKDLIANTCGTNTHQLNQIMASFDNINLPAPKEVTNVEDVQIYVPLPTATEDEEEDIYVGPTDYVKPPTQAPTPTPAQRKSTIVKRELATARIRVDYLKFEKVLGRGSFGKVLLASIKDCEHKVAVKAMKKHTVQANGDVLATAVEKRMLELGNFANFN